MACDLMPIMDEVSERVEQTHKNIKLKYGHVVIFCYVKSTLQPGVLIACHNSETFFPTREYLYELGPMHNTPETKRYFYDFGKF